MTVGATELQDGGMPRLLQNANPNWDDATANYTWVLIDNAHTPADSDATYADISANVCADGDYAAKAVANRTVTDGAANACYLDSDDADFGAAVTIGARYLYCVEGLFSGLNSTDKLIFRIDLNSGGAANVASTAAPFKIQGPTNGWLDVKQA